MVMSKEMQMLEVVKSRLDRLENVEAAFVDMHAQLSDFCIYDEKRGIAIFNPHKNIEDMLNTMAHLGLCLEIQHEEKDAEV